MKSIAVKLWLGITIIVVLILGMIWSFQVGFLKEFYLRERQSTLVSNNVKLSEQIAEYMPTLDFDYDFQFTINSYTDSLNMRVIIFDTDMNILYMTLQGPDFEKNISFPVDTEKILQVLKVISETDRNTFDAIKDPKLISAEFSKRNLGIVIRQLNDLKFNDSFFQNAPFVERIENPHPSNKLILSVEPIMVNSEKVGYVVMHTPIAPIEETITTLKKQLNIITFISLIIAAAMAFFYAAISIKPLRRLEVATNNIAKGDFSTRVTNMPDDEIGQLGMSINRMAEDLGKIEAFRRDFIANVTHELKTPITLISAYAELVKEIPTLDKATTNRHMIDIIEESNRLNNIIEEILYLSKLESNNITLNKIEFCLEPLVIEVIESLNLSIDSKSMDVTSLIGPDFKIIGDRDKLYQVFYNLISNSVHYGNDKGTVTISIKKTHDMSRVQIEDNGPGINPNDLPYIWDRFYKADKSGKRDSTGTGLGLSIVKAILQSHGFNYGIDSSIGKGTTVYFDV